VLGVFGFVFRQLVARGFATVDVEGFGGLQLTEKTWPLLRGEQRIDLRKDIKSHKKKEQKYSRSSQQTFVGNDKILWEALRAKRLELAQSQNVAPYVIFHDSTLGNMVVKHPHTLAEFAQLSGVGATKLNNYGQIFIDVMDAHTVQHGTMSTTVQDKTSTLFNNEDMSESAENTLLEFKRGLSPVQIAAQRELKPTTIYGHLAQAIGQEQLELRQVVKITETEIHLIEDKLLERPQEEQNSLKSVFEEFEGKYDYEILRCVRANLWRHS